MPEQEKKSESTNGNQLKPDELFPYSFRAGQKVIVDKLSSIFTQGAHLVMESGTGTGKTISALTPALCAAVNQKKRIIYLTRTNSQQSQVILELRKLHEKLPKNAIPDKMLLGVGLQNPHVSLHALVLALCAYYG